VGGKRLIPNRGYRRFLKIRAGQCTIDQQRVEEDARYDGKYVLRTTTELPADEVALAYKNLLWIERLFRDLKSLLETRPIYHHWVLGEQLRGQNLPRQTLPPRYRIA
jgi:hypothetical protein